MFVHVIDVRRKWILRGKPMLGSDTPHCWVVLATDGNRLYTYERSKAGSTLEPIGLQLIRSIGDYMVSQKIFTVHEDRGRSWRFDPYGGSLDSAGEVANVGSPCVCIV